MPDNYDISLTIGTTTMSLPLATSNKKKMWEVSEVYAGGNQTDKLFEQDDWSGGWGQTKFKNNIRYADGENIDTTQEGYFMLGGNDGGTNVYFLVDGAVAKDNAAYTNEATAAQNYTTNDMTLLPAAPVVNQDAYYFGYATTFNSVVVNISTQGAGVWTITWKYWDGAAWTALSGVTDGTTGFTATAGPHTVSFTLPGDWATTDDSGNLPSAMYWVKADLTAYTSITTQPKGRQAWVKRSGTSGVQFDDTVTKYIQFSNMIFAAVGEKLFSGTIAGMYHRKTFTVDITDLCVFNSKLYAALGSSTAYQYTSDGYTYTATDLVDDDFTFFIVANNPDGTQPVLWGGDTNYLKNTTNPDASGTQWSDAYYVSDNTSSITGLMLHNNTILAGKTDGLYKLYSTLGSVEYLLPELQYATSTNNFKYHVNWKGSLYFSLNTRIGEWSAYGYYKLVDPYQDIEENITEATCVGLACDNDYLYAAMYNGTDYILFKGNYKKDEYGNKIWSWCPFFDMGTSSVNYITVAERTNNNPYLYFNSGNYFYYIILTDNPLSDSNYIFNVSGGYLITSWYDSGNRDWTKILESVVCECRGYDNDTGGVDLSANVYVKIYYEVDESGTWVAIDSVYSDNNPASGVLTKKYVDDPIPTTTEVYYGKKIRFKIALVTNDESITPVVKYFAAYGQVRPNYVKVFNFAIDIDPDLNSLAVVTPIRDFLLGGRTSTGLVTLVDRHGTSHYVEFLPGSPKEVEILDEPGRYRLVMQIQAQEIDWS